MFLNKYLNPIYLDILSSNYDENYLNLIKVDNFNKIYSLLKYNNFYFIEDIIVNYLELFEIEEKYVELALLDFKSLLGDNFVAKIGKNLMIVDKLIELAISYSEKDSANKQ